MSATKEQEIEALAKIRKIVEDLGVSSYLASAFDGAFGIAESNIEDDAAFTTSYFVTECHTQRATIRSLSTRIEELVGINEGLINVHASEIADIARQRNNFKEAAETWQRDYSSIENEHGQLAADLEDRNAEILRLKARIFDMLEAAK